MPRSHKVADVPGGPDTGFCPELMMEKRLEPRPETAKHRLMMPIARGAFEGRGETAEGVAVAGVRCGVGRCGGDLGRGIGGGESGNIGASF